MEEAFARGAGHLRVDLSDHAAGALHSGGHDIHTYPERAEPHLVRRGDLDQGHVQRQDRLLEEGGHVAQKARRVVAPTGIDRLAGAGTEEEAVDLERVAVLVIGPGGSAEHKDVHQLDIPEPFAALQHRGHQGMGAGGRRTDKDAAPRPYKLRPVTHIEGLHWGQNTL